MKKKNRGFTLIELIVTVAIMAIFSGVVLSMIGTGANSYRQAQQKHRWKHRMSWIRSRI